MTPEDFQLLLERRLDLVKKVLGQKAAEYSRDEDRLWNFKRAAAMLDVTPEQALLGMFAKHMVSIMDMVEDVTDGKMYNYPREVWDEKLGDAINYLILLEGLVNECRK